MALRHAGHEVIAAVTEVVTVAGLENAALALTGGVPVRTAPLPPWPHFSAEAVAASARVLASGRVNYWTGTEGRQFEEEFAARSGSRYAVAVANGTVALELALHALGIGPGDEVVVPAATFVATASAVVAVGAAPVVADVDVDSQCLSARTVEAVLTARTAAVIVVHLAGWPADTAALAALCRTRGLRLVEDCAQAHGARRDGRPVGTSGDVAAWSFCQDKIMTTAGEGGAVTTDDDALRRRCWERKDHGKSEEAIAAPAVPGFRWLHRSFGTNARLSEVQAAVGRVQLRSLDTFVARRRANAEALCENLAGVTGLRLPRRDLAAEHAWYRLWLHVRPEQLAPGWDRDRIVSALVAEGIPAAHGGCTEIQRERAFAALGRWQAPTPVASALGQTSVVLPVHPTLGPDDLADMTSAMRKVMAVAAR